MYAYLLLVFFGFLVSSFFGYLVHKLLHIKKSGKLYESHMEHHLIHYPPNDLTSTKYRKAKFFNSGTFLFTPPLLTVLLIVNLLLLYLDFDSIGVLVFSFSMIFYAIMSDMIHDSFHLSSCFLQRSKFYMKMRERHFIHHKNMKKNYGIISSEIDYILNTLRKK
jgi:sterol desaturase/sphingolipid hydroxylase (fatty acid hydroxylase superfamily)